MSAARDFPLAPLPTRTWVLLGALVVLTLGAVFWSMKDMSADPQRWLVPGLVVVLVLAALASIRRRGITLENEVLVVRASLYTRRVPAAALKLDGARVVDLDEHTGFKPLLKTNGYSLPGFHAGNFRLRNGARAFLLLTGDGRALWLPRHDDTQALLLSPERPQALLDALQGART